MRDAGSLPKDFTLITNARPEKGFDLVMEVAVQVPEISFVAIANQSASEQANRMLADRNISNITVIEKVDDMTPLYEAAYVVVVPSFRFKETFGRVPIEAHRFGKPVIGANAGNLPYLLEESGIVLDEVPKDWARELRRLYDDGAHYAEICSAAYENSGNFTSAKQRAQLDAVVRATREPVLVGIGSGIGNMLHCGPMLRAIARHFGHPVDLVVAEDHQNSLFLLDDPTCVNSVQRMGPSVLERHYDTVFITQCFGASTFTFNSRRTLQSREWDMFVPGKSPHEALFNLEVAEAMLGAPFDREHYVDDYYIGEIQHRWTDGRVVGLHGGSKGGYWSSKRWPGFPELTKRLIAEGYDVRSFGIEAEYVPGAADHTGGSIEEMIDGIRDCNYFVSNDSGVMNIAHALGIPVLSMFGPTEVATRAPLRDNCLALSGNPDGIACEVEDPRKFREGKCTSIENITVDQALATFHDLVGRAHQDVA